MSREIALPNQAIYDIKASNYFECHRREMLPFVPADCHRVLDVGCGIGGFGESLKRTRDVEVWGIEPVESAAKKAAAKLDEVIHGRFNSEAGLPVGNFDCVVFNDVLEHLLDPEEALRYARILLSPAGIIVASIPNIRSLPIVWQLAVHGRWEYRRLRNIR